MRVSVCKDDRGYLVNRRGVRVFLDGVAVHDCRVADEEAGYVITAARDELGNLIHDGQQIKEIKREGRVVVVIDRAASSSSFSSAENASPSA
jgi:hypothetical protein